MHTWDCPDIAAAAAMLAAGGGGTARAASMAPAGAELARGAPVAVLGVGCRLPGGADSAEAFWDLLVSGRNAVSGVPADRWDAEAWYDPDPDAPGRTYARHGGFIEGVRDFDAALFGISPREAESMDPQHRILLEVAWHALEHAAIAPDSLRSSRTGVFIGMGGSDYERVAARSAAPLDAYSATGLTPNFAANRLSFTLGLQGPSLVVDTACSSSLVAVHLACQALRAGECDLALAGGVNLMLSPDAMVALAKGRMLSVSGQCRTFDAAADGYVRGEGAGIVVLRRLSDAERGRDPVLAVIRGTAVNQDGATAGITVPRGAAQEDVIRRAMAAARVTADQVGYVEAHGTGTALGDPIEIRALAAVMTPRTSPLAVGSVKTNIGHLEAAAGIAGLIKAVLAVHHGVIPPHLNLTDPSPHIPWTPDLTVPAAPVPWTAPDRIAGVSSFGFGGTNAHLIVQNHPPSPAPADPGPPPGTPHVIPLSANTPAALRAAAAALAAHQAAAPAPLHQLAWAAATTRATLPHRAAITAATTADLTRALHHLAAATPHPAITTSHHPPTRPPHITMLIPGHGARLRGALAGLYPSDPAVTETLDSLAQILGPVTEPPISTLITADPPDAERAEHLQPALYALTLALAAWWRARGVVPHTVLGHSAGAYAAATLAGIIGTEDGARLARRRGQLLAGLPGDGVMAVVACGAERLAGIGPLASGEAVIAAYHGPAETVIAGPRPAVTAVVDLMTARGIRSKLLHIPVAGHSPQMDAMLGPLGEAFAAIPLRPPQIGFVSDATGLTGGAEVTTADYWVRHTRQPLQFGEALRTAFDRGTTIMIELGSGGLLPIASALSPAGDTAPALIASLSTHIDPRSHLAQALGRAWAAGAAVDWAGVMTAPAAPLRLPGYPFQRRTCWLPGPGSPLRPSPTAADAPDGSPGEAADAPDGSPGKAADAAALPATAGAAARFDAGSLTSWLRAAVAAALDLPHPERLDPDAGLFDLGITSAMTVELRAGLEQIVGRPLPTTLFFDHPTIRKLAGHLAAGPQQRTLPAARRPTPRAARPAAPEPIAIIGIGCRLPGGVVDPRSYWALLMAGRDATGPVPESRWDADAFYDPDPAAPGKAHTRRGGFLGCRVDEFDAAAFGISPREARSMDPQQRLLLEVACEALADAGCTDEGTQGTNTGVYVAINTTDYLNLLSTTGAAGEDPYLATGNTFSVAAGRLSYLLGARGPSMAVDTACSSSLVATHLAVRALRAGETDMALVAGVNLMLSPATTVSLAKLRALSPDGRCKSFSAAADGYGRGEGCGVVVIKRLSDAIASGDRIWALIRGSAVNQDGLSAGLTVPNGQAQRDVIRAALRDADVEPAAVSYVEAHGTGTPLGDPVEVYALADAFRPGSAPGLQPLTVGSVKANIGHLEAAAGIAGLIKAALMLHQRRIPAHLHFDEPSPHIEWERLPVRIPREAADWAAPEGSRIAGVSAFGFSGTNAHVVLEEAPAIAGEPVPEATDPEPAGPRLLLLSARTPEALLATAASYRELLGTRPECGPPGDGFVEPDASWTDIARTAALHRSHLPHRLAVVAATEGQAADSLAALLDGTPPAGVHVGEARWDERSRLIAVYGGQGSQWPAMGRDLLAEPDAAAVIDRCETVVRELAGWSLRAALTAPRESSPLHDTRIAQPAVFAVQAALTELWRCRGVEPDAIIGHSVGEIAAAYAAGVYDLETACRIAVHRGAAMAPTRGAGAMAAVGLGVAQAEALIAGRGGVSVAAVNSPVSTVLAGERDALAGLEAEVRARGAFWATVQEEYAFHSPMMAVAQETLTAALAGLAPRPPTRPLFSTVTGQRAGSSLFDADYWVQNMMQPVLFSAALRAAAGEGHNAVLEIGPHPVLAKSAMQSLEGAGAGATAVVSMRARHDARETMLGAAGALHVLGYRLNHRALHPATGRRARLPAYPWQRQRYWLPGRPGATAASQAAAHAVAVPDELPGKPRDRRCETAGADAAGDRELLDSLRAAAGPARGRLLEDAVQAEVAAVLGHAAGTRLERELGFFDAGMDSITSVDLRGRLEKRLGRQLPPTVAFEHPNVASLTEFLLGELFGAGDARDPAQAAGEPGDDGSMTELAARLDQMSEDELTAALVEELERESRHDNG